MKNYFPIIDILKFIFATLIACHHAEINLLINSGIESKIFGTSYLAVEGFLLISGYFIASSANSLARKDYTWSEVIWKRIKRIHPIFLYCLLIFLIYDSVTYFTLGFNRYNIADIFSTIFMVGDVFFMKQLIGFWYMPVFLWCGFFYLYILLYYPDVSRKLIIPTTALLGYSWIYHQFGGLPLHVDVNFR